MTAIHVPKITTRYRGRRSVQGARLLPAMRVFTYMHRPVLPTSRLVRISTGSGPKDADSLQGRQVAPLGLPDLCCVLSSSALIRSSRAATWLSSAVASGATGKEMLWIFPRVIRRGGGPSAYKDGQPDYRGLTFALRTMLFSCSVMIVSVSQMMYK